MKQMKYSEIGMFKEYYTYITGGRKSDSKESKYAQKITLRY